MNKLILRKKLINLLKNAGIKRVSQKALDEINFNIYAKLEEMAKFLKQDLEIKGKKTLEKEDIEEMLRKNKIEDLN